MTDREAAFSTMEEYAAAYCAKDADRLVAVFDAGEEISPIGTGADEFGAGRAATRRVFERSFAEATATRLEWCRRRVAMGRGFATIAAKVSIHHEFERVRKVVPLRWTATLARRAEGGRWLHRHASAAAGAQKARAAYSGGEG